MGNDKIKVPLKFQPPKNFFNEYSMDKFKPKFDFYYTVRKGENLSTIAQQCGVTLKALCDANGLDSKAVIKSGQVLKIHKSCHNAILSMKSTTNGIPDFSDVSDIKISKPYAMMLNQTSYTVQSGETLSEIEARMGLKYGELAAYNKNIDPDSISEGTTLQIPRRVIADNIKNVKDVSKATGMSPSFVNQIIKIEKKSNKAYVDPKGNLTIGVGHMAQNDFEKNYYKNKNLSDKAVYTLLAKDIIVAQNAVITEIGENNYKALSNSQKESLTDYVFNRGENIFRGEKCQTMVSALKSKRFGVAGTMFDLDTSVQNDSILYGISKRRMFEMSHYYNGNIPSAAVKSAQRLYNIAYNANVKGGHGNLDDLNDYVNHLFKGKVKTKK
ncbi:MAG: LysM peptidoglycan-binding domain-containing protein [Clostridiaceae bacterium]|nr:LysM peptidoglycan-binding domain-containing protein [Clostridiaceae bacterium]